MTVRIGYVILAHQDPHLVARLARLLLANDGVVAIHYDLAAGAAGFETLQDFLGTDAERVHWARRVEVAWGQWSIVEATLNALEALVASNEALDFVHLMSGTDYPIRPISEFKAYLAAHSRQDFIEAVDMFSGDWVREGLTHERYRYRHYFNWKTHTKLFDRNWALQRRLRLERRFPQSLRPHMGSQWWTLTWRTAEEVLAAGRDPALASFFRTVWIPDEMFVQTVVGSAHSAPSNSGRNLTLYQFTDKGVPVVYCNDHAEYLARQPFFFARKISRHADRLRDALDAMVAGTRPVASFETGEYGYRTQEYETHRARSAKPAAGVRLLGHDVDHWRGDLAVNRRPIVVVLGACHEELKSIAALFNETSTIFCHGALFHPNTIEFADGAETYAGYSNSDLKLRDNFRQNFLNDIVQEADPKVTVGFLSPWGTEEGIIARLIWSPLARILIVKGNVVRAFVEHQKKNAPGESFDGKTSERPAGEAYRMVGPQTSLDNSATFDDFNEFLIEYDKYYANLQSACANGTAAVRIVDLMAERADRDLIDFSRPSASISQFERPRMHSIFAERLKALRDSTGATFPDELQLIDRVHDTDRRELHKNAYRNGRALSASRPTFILLGASQSELMFVADLLNRTGRFAIHGDLFHPARIEFIGGATSHAGYRCCDTDLRDADRRKFFHDVANHHGNHLAFGLIAPWQTTERELLNALVWNDLSRVVIVRGNVLTAFAERATSETHGGDSSSPSAGSSLHGNWINPTAFREFLDQYSHYHQMVRETCEEAGAVIGEIDLVSDDWLQNLALCIEGSDKSIAAIMHRLTRDDIIELARSISDAHRGIRNAQQLLGLIDDHARRASHFLVLAENDGVAHGAETRLSPGQGAEALTCGEFSGLQPRFARRFAHPSRRR